MSNRRSMSDSGLVALAGRAPGAEGAAANEQTDRACGQVWLVGAGPGDPDLLTLQAARLLATADVVVHDRLVGPGILALIPPAARRLYVGKRKSHHSLPQDDVNDLLIGLAREGLRVVRLKGGDPFLFGRGGEELLACRRAGVPCAVAPGVSAAVAASAAIGAPLTHRGLAQSVTFVTGHAAVSADGQTGDPDLDWDALARPHHTVAVYMGLSSAAMIAARLIEAGRSPATPVALIEKVSLGEERRLTATLADLPAAAASLSGPVILIIGEVASLAQAGEQAGEAAAPLVPGPAVTTPLRRVAS
jgi:uroporphyrin-III C-methyltransferase